jgi:hypothetical protein
MTSNLYSLRVHASPVLDEIFLHGARQVRILGNVVELEGP